MHTTFVSIALSLLVAGCAERASTTDGELQTAPDPAASYRVVVSLTSLGTGIDTEAYNEILARVGAYDIDLSPDVYGWGLEGETNLCFSLHGLNAQAQALFVSDIAGVVEGTTTIYLHENERCDVFGTN